jgi:TfoX/Sxy family transcriptional regulator of competence genes
MAYDKEIETAVNEVLKPEEPITSKKMFGGVGYLYRGNMAFGILNDCLIVRLGSDEAAKAHIEAGRALPFDVTGKAMKGWVMVSKSTLAGRQGYRQWLERGLAFARSLPPK